MQFISCSFHSKQAKETESKNEENKSWSFEHIAFSEIFSLDIKEEGKSFVGKFLL